ncbi:hypothetical protein [Candidatus Contubernalis alkaliaceticus]|uniref:hypothetical protein n=1 Tax=Candidatus Contubernalis alkaliaceticus TaxID=338645 RepID=UPI001F4C402B|nr:hypothetical protein [Candidatus Contubernalis alkalaceticus]UNC91157.1 hypothetical protein HUE98_03075 [Candidatus Contubernalis alkalaceticus]
MKNPHNKKGCKVTINCTFYEDIELKTFAKVQLLVPSFGFSPEPPACSQEPEKKQYQPSFYTRK